MVTVDSARQLGRASRNYLNLHRISIGRRLTLCFVLMMLVMSGSKLLGVHALGQRATEIIHIGQAVLFYNGSVEYFRDMVFNYPTLAEAYKVAALNGLNKL